MPDLYGPRNWLRNQSGLVELDHSEIFHAEAGSEFATVVKVLLNAPCRAAPVRLAAQFSAAVGSLSAQFEAIWFAMLKKAFWPVGVLVSMVRVASFAAAAAGST